MANKYPQMSTLKVLVQKMFEFDDICTWPSLLTWHNLARWLGVVLWNKRNLWLLKYGGLKGLQISPNECHKSLGAQKF